MQEKSKVASPRAASPVVQTYTIREVCDILKISRKTLFNYSHWYKGRPPILHSISVRNAVRFSVAALQDFITQREGASLKKRAA